MLPWNVGICVEVLATRLLFNTYSILFHTYGPRSPGLILDAIITRLNHELLQLSDCTAQSVYTTGTRAVDVDFSPLVGVSVVDPRRQGLTCGWPLRAPASFRGEQGLLMLSLLIPCPGYPIHYVTPRGMHVFSDICSLHNKARKAGWFCLTVFLNAHISSMFQSCQKKDPHAFDDRAH